MPQLVIEVIGDASNLERTFRRVERQTQTFGRRMERFVKVGAFAGVTAAATGLAVAFKAGFDEMAEGQKVAAQTRAALKSTGNVAGVTAGHIETLAESLQKMSGADDEAVQSAENLLLTFTRIRGQAIFDQATTAVLDLSQALGQDLNTSAIQLGKALNDPVRGVTALRRVGITFSDDQQRMIRRLVETNDVLGAQKVILEEVQREVGGSAKAYGETLPGKLKILQGNLENIAGTLVEDLAPALEDLTDRFNKWLSDPERKRKIIDDWTTAINNLATAAAFAADAIGAMVDARNRIKDWPGKGPSGLDIFNKIVSSIRAPSRPGTPGLGPGAAAAAAAVEAARGGSRGIGAGYPNISPVQTLLDQVRSFTAVGQANTTIGRVVDFINKWADAGKKFDDAQKAAAARRARMELQRQRFRAALENQWGWLEFGLEKAQATKTLRDDREALRRQEKWLLNRIAHAGRTLDLVSRLWRVRQQIRDLNKSKAQDGDPLAGLMQVSSKRMAGLLGAGLGLSPAGLGRLQQNISGQEIHNYIHLDGREVARSTNRANAQTTHRTSRQTSGFRG